MSNMNVGNVLEMIQVAEKKINSDFMKSDFVLAQERKRQDLLRDKLVAKGSISSFLPIPKK